MWPHWLNEALVNWQSSFSDFWFGIGRAVGVVLNFQTTKFLTVLLLLIITVIFSDHSQKEKLTKVGFIRFVVGLILATLVLIIFLLMPIVSNNELSHDLNTALINWGILILGLVILLIMIMKFSDLRNLARTAWQFIGVFFVLFLIFLGNIIYVVMESLDAQ